MDPNIINRIKQIPGEIGQGFGTAFNNGVQGMRNAIEGAMQPQNPYPQLKAPIPPSEMVTHQLPQGVQSPIPENQIIQHQLGLSPFGQGVANLQQSFGRLFAAPQTQQSQPQQPISIQSTPTPTQTPLRIRSPYQPNITIPYSQTGQPFQLPAQLSQTILNAFNDAKQATNAAQVLNHPPDDPYLEGDPKVMNYNTYGENASFNGPDNTNVDGSVDRGLFRVNSNTFNGIMAHPFFGQVARQKFGINSWEDMKDPQKNAYMARLILERGNWNPAVQSMNTVPSWRAWFAAPKQLRAANYTPGQPIKMQPLQPSTQLVRKSS